VRAYRGEDAYTALVSEVQRLFQRGDVPDLVRAVDRNFGDGTYSVHLLFRDQQRKIVGLIMEKALSEAASLYRNFYAQYATLARFVSDLSLPLPARFQMAVDFTLHEDLLEALSAAHPDSARIRTLLEQIGRTGILLDSVTLEFAFRRSVERAADHFKTDPFDRERVRRFYEVVSLASELPFTANLWAAQNIFHQARQVCSMFGGNGVNSANGQEWRAAFDALGSTLGFSIESCGAQSVAAEPETASLVPAYPAAEATAAE
jgi:hypothetical protein